MVEEYIFPNLKSINKNSLSQSNGLLKDLSTYSEFISEKSLDFFQQRSLVVGEPGYGKTALIKHINKKNPDKSIFIDLKKVAFENESSLENYVFQEYASTSCDAQSLSKHLFLDGFDEVEFSNQNLCLSSIYKYLNNYPKTTFTLSCRSNYLEIFWPRLKEVICHIYEIQSFDLKAVITFLQLKSDRHKNLTNDEIYFEIKNSSFYSYDSYLVPNGTNSIQIPRYLKMLCELLNRDYEITLQKLKRSELFEYSIRRRLRLEAEKAPKQQNYRFKSSLILVWLERLALIMEIKMTNIITKEEFVEFMLDTNSNIDSQILLETFYNNTILKGTNDHIEFDNTEFQEYLAARCLVKFQNTEQLIFDLAFDKTLKNMHPSWFNTISYAVEIENSTIIPLVKNALTNRDYKTVELIRFNHNLGSNIASPDNASLNQMLVDFYLNNEIFIGYETPRYIAKMFPNDNKQVDRLLRLMIINAAERNSRSNSTVNLIYLLNAFVRYHNIDMKIIGKIEVLYYNYLRKEDFETDVRKTIARGLKYLTKINKLLDFLNEYPNIRLELLDVFTGLTLELDNTHKISTKYLVELLVLDENSVTDYLNATENSEWFYLFMKNILNNLKNAQRKGAILRKISSYIASSYEYKEKFYKNLEKILTADAEDIFDAIIFSSCNDYSCYDNQFLINLAKVCCSNNEEWINEFCNWLFADKVDKSGAAILFLGNVLDAKQFERFERSYQNSNFKTEYFPLLIRAVYSTLSHDELHGKFPEYFALKNNTHKRSTAVEKKLEIIKEIKHTSLLDGYSLIYTFNNYKEKHSQEFDENTRKLIVAKCLRLFNSYNPLDASVTINKSGSYTPENGINYWIQALNAASTLKLDVSAHTVKIMSLIPHDNSMNVIKYIGEVSDVEANEFAEWLNNAKNKKNLQIGTNGFLRVISSNFNPIYRTFLISVIENQTCKDYDQIRAIQLLVENELIEEKLMLKYFESEDHETSFKLEVNRQLICIFMNQAAVKWRMALILENRYSFIPDDNSYLYSQGEFEGYGRALGSDNHNINASIYYDFLDKGISRYNNEVHFEEWLKKEVIYPSFEYFSFSAKSKNKAVEIVSELNSLIDKSTDHQKHLAFKTRRLKERFAERYQPTRKMSEAINLYNKFKAYKYLEVRNVNDLLNIVQSSIDLEMKQWIQQGYYSFINQLYKLDGGRVARENIIQETIKTQLENFLLQKDIRKVDILREVQLQGGKKVDFLISYGLIGKIAIEVKRFGNNDLNKLSSYFQTHLKAYTTQTNSSYCILLIFNDTEKNESIFTAKCRSYQKVLDQRSEIKFHFMHCL